MNRYPYRSDMDILVGGYMFLNIEETIGNTVPLILCHNDTDNRRGYMVPIITEYANGNLALQHDADNILATKYEIFGVIDYINDKIDNGLELYDYEGNLISDFNNNIRILTNPDCFRFNISFGENNTRIYSVGYMTICFDATLDKEFNTIISEAIINALSMQVFILMQLIGIFNKYNDDPEFKLIPNNLFWDNVMIDGVMGTLSDQIGNIYNQFNTFDISGYLQGLLDKNEFDHIITNFEVIKSLNCNNDLYEAKVCYNIEDDLYSNVNLEGLEDRDTSFNSLDFVNFIVINEEYK